MNKQSFTNIPDSVTLYETLIQLAGMRINEKAATIKKKFPIPQHKYRIGEFPPATFEMFPWLARMSPGLPYVFEMEKTKIIKAKVPHLHSILHHFLGLPVDQTLYDVNNYLQKLESAAENQWTEFNNCVAALPSTLGQFVGHFRSVFFTACTTFKAIQGKAKKCNP